MDQNDLRRIIKQFRKSRRCTMSLEISEWMSNTNSLEFTLGDVATHLDLMSKVHGIKEGEKYFNAIPEDSRGIHVHNALLNCYTRVQLMDKAEATMQKMRELGYAGPLAYSNMLKLYSATGDQEKLKSLAQEMKEKGISFDRLSYSVQLHAYAAVLDIAGLEDLLQKMEADSAFIMDWDTYAKAANVFLKAGKVEKAKLALEKSEQLIGDRITTNGYESLMTLYARMGSKGEVLRLWNVRKEAGKIHYSSYSSVITSLVKLNDIDTAEKLLLEWLAEKMKFDGRVVNCLVKYYCGTGYTEKAELLVGKLREGGHEPSVTTWNQIIMGYRKCNKSEKAVDTLITAVNAGSIWKPNLPTLTDCLGYLKTKGDVDGVKQIVSMLVARGRLPKKVKGILETRLDMKL